MSRRGRVARSRHPAVPWSPHLVAVVGLSAAAFLYVTVETLPIGLLQSLASDLGASNAKAGQLVTVYGLVVVLAGMPLTYATRGLPRRAVILSVLAVYVVSTAAAAASPSYDALVLSRVVTALSQALFWSIVIPTAIALFAQEVRGRIVGLVFAGSSLAAVVGVPAATWLGQATSWRAAFALLALTGVPLAAMLAAFLRPGHGREPDAAGAAAPDRGRFRRLLVATALVVTGSFAFFTYVSPYLTDAAGISEDRIGTVLLVRGLAGLVGVSVGGLLVDRCPRRAIMGPVCLQAVALCALAAGPTSAPLVVALIGLTGLTFAMLTTALATRVLEVAPGRLDMAASAASTAVNCGIAGGALLGGRALERGAASPALLGAALTVLAIGPLLVDARRR